MLDDDIDKETPRITLNESRIARIEQITQQLEDLSTELNRLILEEAYLIREDPSTAAAAPTQSRLQEFAIGQRVEITNNHNGLRGARGTITAISQAQVWLIVDGHRRAIRKKKTNVRIVNEI